MTAKCKNAVEWTVLLHIAPFCVLQDHLLEVAWNNSQSTQRDVEKSFNCCGFTQVDMKLTCDAVSFDQCSCPLLHFSMLKQIDGLSVVRI